MSEKEVFFKLVKEVAMFQRLILDRTNYRKSMSEFSFTVSEGKFSKDQFESLVKLGLMEKKIVQVTTRPMTAYDARRGFKAKTFHQAEYSFTQKAIDYVSSIKGAVCPS